MEMNEFKSLTIAIMASTETQTLRKTVELLLKHCKKGDISEILIFLISDECPSAAVAAEIIKNNNTSVTIRCGVQKENGFSQAIFEITQFVNSSHFIIIAADLEMDPFAIPKMIEIGKEKPNAIVCASKFQKGSHRENYGLLHYVCNRAVNGFIECLLHVKGTEITIFFQLYPKAVFDEMGFDNPATMYCEYTIRPLTQGVEYIEIPTNYVHRSEGTSNFNLKKYINLGVSFVKAAFRERKRMKAHAK